MPRRTFTSDDEHKIWRVAEPTETNAAYREEYAHMNLPSIPLDKLTIQDFDPTGGTCDLSATD